MKYSTRRKTTSTEKDMIVWAEISHFLTQNRESIRKNRIPKVHEQRINELLTYLEAWKEGKKLVSEDEIKQKLSEIDLKTIVAEKIFYLD